MFYSRKYVSSWLSIGWIYMPDVCPMIIDQIRVFVSLTTETIGHTKPPLQSATGKRALCSSNRHFVGDLTWNSCLIAQIHLTFVAYYL